MDSSKALEQLDKASIRSKKFQALVLTLGVMTAIGWKALELVSPADLVQAILFAMFLLGGGYVGSTAWQDRSVRMAAVLRGAKDDDGVPEVKP